MQSAKTTRGGRREGSLHERGGGTGVARKKMTGMRCRGLTGDVHQPDWHLRHLKLPIRRRAGQCFVTLGPAETPRSWDIAGFFILKLPLWVRL